MAGITLGEWIAAGERVMKRMKTAHVAGIATSPCL